VRKHPQVILAMYFYLGQEQKDAYKRNLCYIYSFVGILLIIDLNKKKGKKRGGILFVNFTVK
jgi:hypothetical protein